jgi:hypothetical protein
MSAPLQSRMTSNGRTYTDPLTGATFPSVTNILGVIDKPALKFWAAKSAAEAAVRYFNERRVLFEATGDWSLDPKEAVETIKRAPWRKSGDAAERGTDVHAAVEELVCKGMLYEPEEWSPEVLAHVAQYQRFADDFEPFPLFAEATCYSTTYGYAGTLDIIADLPGRGLFVLDIKTGKGIYPEAALQLAAYRWADYMITGPPWERHEMPPTVGAAALHLQANKYDLIEVDAGADTLAAFVVAANFATFHRERYNALVGAPLVPTK